MHGWTPLLMAHVAGATVALFLGAFNLLRPLRGDRAHKTIGYAWVVLMYWVAVSSFFIHEINDGSFSPVHILSVVVLVTLSLGIYHARRGNVKAHRGLMRGTYFGLLGALLGAAVVPQRLLPQLVVNEPAVFTASLLGAIVVSAGIIWTAFLVFPTRRKKAVVDENAE